MVSSSPENEEEENEEEVSQLPPENYNIIDYAGIDDSVRFEAQSFKPFTNLSVLATSFIRKKDSLRSVGTDAFKEQERRAHNAILNYKRDLESGKLVFDPAPALLELTRRLGDKDSSFIQLSNPGGASFFNGVNFFFIGGAPFVHKVVSYDSITNQEKSFTDLKGNPELRFRTSLTENAFLLFKSIMHFKKPKIKVSFGGPTPTYDASPDEVNGIGSIIHNFDQNIPVVFLTESGLVNARLIYCEFALTEQYSCYSSFPRIVFASNANIQDTEILGIYIPYGDSNPTTCKVSRKKNWLWTIDLNGDATPDIGCVIGATEGISDDALVEIIWFANVNGEWKIIDYGEEPACT